MRQFLFLLAFAVAIGFVLGACGDDDDTVATSPDGAATTTVDEEAAVATTTTTATAAVEATYEFAMQSDYGFGPTAVDADALFVYPGQVLGLEYIELDPEGDPCPTEAEIEVTDTTGAVVATGSGTTIEMPPEAAGPLTVTVVCERDGEPGVGVWGPLRVAEMVQVTVSPTTIVTGESVTVELAEGCPDGLEGRAGLTPADAEFGVLGPTPALAEDGSAELTVPEGATGTFYATVQCYDEETMTMAVGWAEFEAAES